MELDRNLTARILLSLATVGYGMLALVVCTARSSSLPARPLFGGSLYDDNGY